MFLTDHINLPKTESDYYPTIVILAQLKSGFNSSRQVVCRYSKKEVIVKDMEAYQYLLLGKITRIEGVTGVHSSFVMREVVSRTILDVK